MSTKKLTKKDVKNSLFYQLPKFLFLDSKYKEMSNDSKILYSIYMDRARLSIKNNWIDSDNFVYIKFKNKKIMEILNIASEKLAKLKRELHEFNLIDEVVQGVKRPNIIYVLVSNDNNLDINEFDDIEDDIDVVSTENSSNSKIEHGAFENRTRGIRKSNTNYTDFNNTDTNYIINTSLSEQNSDEQKFKNNNKIFENDSVEIRLSEYLFKKMQENNAKVKQPNFNTWAKNIDLLLRIDKRTEEEVKKIIDFCQKDSFWRSNILSTSKLRDRFDQLWIKMQELPKQQYSNGNMVNGKPIQSTNYEQREYDDEFFDSLYTNLEYIK